MKKISQIRIMVILWIVLLVGSCTNNTINNSTNIENPQKSKDLAIESNSTNKSSSVLNEHEIIGGWLKESTNQQAVLDKLGLPTRKGKDEYWGATGTYVQNWEYTALGITLEMESESQGSIKKVLSIIVMQPCKFTTSQGVGIGVNGKTVREKYNKLIDATNSNAESIVVGSVYGGTVFTLKNGIVSEIFIGAVAE